MTDAPKFPPYRKSLARNLLAAREAVLVPTRPVLRAGGVTEQQWRVLRVLADDGPAEPAELSSIALLHAPSVTRILRELTARELVHREYDTRNPRRSVVSITPQGTEVVRTTAHRSRVMLDPVWDAFGRQRLAKLQAELTAFIACAKSLALDASAHPEADNS
jgi:homoprotocatechuate degradation regulator HpaR